MKKVCLVLVSLLFPLLALADSSDNRAEWIFSKNKSDKAVSHFLETGIYNSTSGVAGARLSFCRKGNVVESSINEKGYPTALSQKGDYWLFELPVQDVDAESVFDFYLPFMGNEGQNNNFVLEYRDGKRWIEAATVTSTNSDKHPRRLWYGVRLKKAIEGNGVVALRLRQTEKRDVQFTIASPSARGQYPTVVRYNPKKTLDTVRMLFIGNSYTYYYNYPLIFKEIAWSEGHYADCNIFISGGYTMAQHLANPHSVEQIDKGGYDYVMLQDQSVLPTLNGTADDAGMVENMGKMINRVRASSPESNIFVELTWGRKLGNNNFGKYEPYLSKYPQFYSSYDAMQNRLNEVMEAEVAQLGVNLHPLGYAWQIVMHERPDINLYYKDNHHQSYAGSYLSAAVAYLAIYGKPFGDSTANGKLDAQIAAYLRSVAERVVLNGEKWMGK